MYIISIDYIRNVCIEVVTINSHGLPLKVHCREGYISQTEWLMMIFIIRHLNDLIIRGTLRLRALYFEGD